MSALFIGVGQATLLLRHARTLKDRRSVVRSLIQKLRNHGFSATEESADADPKQARLGFCYAGHDYGSVKRILQEAKANFVGDFYLSNFDQDIFQYEGGAGIEDPLPDWEEEKT